MVRNLQAEMPILPIKVFGRLDAFLMDPETDEIVQEVHTPNTVVDGGEILIAELLAGEDLGGTGLSYAGAGDLGLGLQFCQVGVDGSDTTQGMYGMIDTSGITTNNYTSLTLDIASPGNIITAASQFTYNDGNHTTGLREAGLFTNTSAPSSKTDTSSRMFNRVNFATINKNDSYQLTLNWTITIGSVA